MPEARDPKRRWGPCEYSEKPRDDPPDFGVVGYPNVEAEGDKALGVVASSESTSFGVMGRCMPGIYPGRRPCPREPSSGEPPACLAEADLARADKGECWDRCEGDCGSAWKVDAAGLGLS